jgi:hypothetical protein
MLTGGGIMYNMSTAKNDGNASVDNNVRGYGGVLGSLQVLDGQEKFQERMRKSLISSSGLQLSHPFICVVALLFKLRTDWAY